MTLSDKMHSYEICKALNVELLIRIERSQLRWFGHLSRMPQERLVRQVLAKPQKSSHGSPKDQVEWLLFRPSLITSWCWVSRTIWDCCWSWDILCLHMAAASV